MKEIKQGCDLKDCFLCKHSLPEWLQAVAVHKKNFRVKKGEVIFNEGDKVTGIYFANDTTVKVHKKWGKDKELIIRLANKGAIFGHRGLGGNGVYPISATALEPGMLCYIDIGFFEATLKTNNDFAYNLMLFFADELKESERKMRNLAHMSVKGRLAQALITLKDQFGVNDDGSIAIEVSRQDLASFAGATYETVFRVMNELLKEEIVRVSGKKIIISDPEKLLHLTADDL
jgi:CRP/FNR family transcriptional regulator